MDTYKVSKINCMVKWMELSSCKMEAWDGMDGLLMCHVLPAYSAFK
jgi:hypothetical protein